MTSELVERLELVAAWHTPAGRTPKMPRPPIHTTCRQAIAEIERLTAQLAEARQAERVHRGEFICTKCYLRQDADFTPGDF